MFDGNLNITADFQQTASVHIPGEQPRTALPLVSFDKT